MRLILLIFRRCNARSRTFLFISLCHHALSSHKTANKKQEPFLVTINISLQKENSLIKIFTFCYFLVCFEATTFTPNGFRKRGESLQFFHTFHNTKRNFPYTEIVNYLLKWVQKGIFFHPPFKRVKNFYWGCAIYNLKTVSSRQNLNLH